MYKYYVLINQQLTSTTFLLTLKKDPLSKPFAFQPGQYVAISFRNNGRPTPARCFSIVSSPIDREYLQFSVRKKGRFTKALSELVAGDEVMVSGPFGSFVMDTETDADIVMIAGGIGIAPFMSMIKYATVVGLHNNMNLIYSNSSQDDVPFLNEIFNLGKRNSRLKTTFVVGHGPSNKLNGLKVSNGRITSDIIEGSIGRYGNKSFLICGPPRFMNSIVKLLLDQGVSVDRITTEAFGPGANKQTSKTGNWAFSIYTIGAVGMFVASFSVMIRDILQTPPPSTSTGSTSSTDSSNLTNSRQNELDDLVNDLPAASNNAPATNPNSQVTQQPSVSPPVPTAAPTTPVTPTPTHTPVCTTTQSGVTTCI